MDFFLLALGLLLLAPVAIQLYSYSTSSLSGIGYERERQRLQLELLRQRVEAARALRARNEAARFAWNGFRKLVVARKVCEADDICSFYLVPHDHKPLPRFEPGQFLTFQLDIPGQPKPVVRCYSLSDAYREDSYRITIKRVPSPPDHPAASPGLISNYFHDHVEEGTILDVKAPGGKFVFDPLDRKPAVLIAGGVGITPMLSMVNAVAALESPREVWLFYGVRNRREHAFGDHLHELERKRDNVRVVACYSNPGADDAPGRDFKEAGRVSVELIQKYLSTSNYQFYLCGPPGMMKAVSEQLAAWGVPKSDILTEAFGPASVKAKVAASSASAPDKSTAAAVKIKFARSGKQLTWREEAGNILEFARQNGVDIQSGCCAGNCGTCQVAVKSGEVRYNQEPEFPDLSEGCCLTCIGVPTGDLVIDV